MNCFNSLQEETWVVLACESQRSFPFLYNWLKRVRVLHRTLRWRGLAALFCYVPASIVVVMVEGGSVVFVVLVIGSVIVGFGCRWDRCASKSEGFFSSLGPPSIGCLEQIFTAFESPTPFPAETL